MNDQAEQKSVEEAMPEPHNENEQKSEVSAPDPPPGNDGSPTGPPPSANDLDTVPEAGDEQAEPHDEAEKFVEKFGNHLDDTKAALAHLKTSSNADHPGTIVHDAIGKLDKAVEGLDNLYHFFKSKL